MDEVFGCITRDREGWESASAVIYPDGTRAKVCFLWHAYELTTGLPAAAYEDKRTAIVVNSFGKGKAIIAGTEVFRQYMDKPEDATTCFLRNAVLGSGVLRIAQVLINNEATEATGIEVCRLEGEPGIVYIALNHNETPLSFRLAIRETDSSWFDLNTGDSVTLDDDIVLPPLGVLVFAKENGKQDDFTE